MISMTSHAKKRSTLNHEDYIDKNNYKDSFGAYNQPESQRQFKTKQKIINLLPDRSKSAAG